MNMDDFDDDVPKTTAQSCMAKLEENSTWQCLASDTCKKCCTIWSCVAIGFLVRFVLILHSLLQLVIGLVQGEAFYQVCFTFIRFNSHF